jgi:hypothetical protein
MVGRGEVLGAIIGRCGGGRRGAGLQSHKARFKVICAISTMLSMVAKFLQSSVVTVTRALPCSLSNFSRVVQPLVSSAVLSMRVVTFSSIGRNRRLVTWP